MPTHFQIDKQDAVYFLTSTVVGWVDLFIREEYKMILADSLNFCIEKKGLVVYAYVIMPSHLHMIASARNNDLSKVIGSFKQFTSKKLMHRIESQQESRKEWMLPIFTKAGKENSRNKNHQIWLQDNHAEEVYSRKFTLSKINYIHMNPVEEGFVEHPHEYLYGSARDYSGLKSPVKVTLINLHSLFY